MGAGNGTFPRATSVDSLDAPRQVKAADLDDDGKPDLVVTSRGDSNTRPSVSVYLGHGDGTFSAGIHQEAAGEADALTVVDFNGDGLLDVAASITSAHTVSLWMGLGDGSLSARRDATTKAYPRGLAPGDFNGDGWIDLVVSQEGSNSLRVLTAGCAP